MAALCSQAPSPGTAKGKPGHAEEPLTLLCFAGLTLHFLKASKAAQRGLHCPEGTFSTSGNDRRCFSCFPFHPVTDQEPRGASGSFCHGKNGNESFIQEKSPTFLSVEAGIVLGWRHCATEAETPMLSLDCSRAFLGCLEFVFLKMKAAAQGIILYSWHWPDLWFSPCLS